MEIYNENSESIFTFLQIQKLIAANDKERYKIKVRWIIVGCNLAVLVSLITTWCVCRSVYIYLQSKVSTV
jgi:hypothetical protein